MTHPAKEAPHKASIQQRAAERNRKLFPAAAEIVDRFQAAFEPHGMKVRLLHVVEGDREAGTPIDDSEYVRVTHTQAEAESKAAEAAEQIYAKAKDRKKRREALPSWKRHLAR